MMASNAAADATTSDWEAILADLIYCINKGRAERIWHMVGSLNNNLDCHGVDDPAGKSCLVGNARGVGCEEGERHLEVRVGNVETEADGRQVLGAVAKADTDIKVLIRRSLDAVGRTEVTVLTAFTDGCCGLRRILADAGVTALPIRDWFHIAMRLHHLKQIASVDTLPLRAHGYAGRASISTPDCGMTNLQGCSKSLGRPYPRSM